MTTVDIMAHISTWLERWEISDLDSSSPWLQEISLKNFDAEDYLVHAGESSDTLFLLQSGLVRLFYTTPDGRERNKAFFRAEHITGPVSAAMTSTPAPFSIQALEPIEARTMPYPALMAAAEQNASMARISQQMLAEAFIRNEQREALLLTCNAEQRYQWLLDNETDLLGRVAQFHIASYLGIDAVSLSRLKRKHRQ